MNCLALDPQIYLNEIFFIRIPIDLLRYFIL